MQHRYKENSAPVDENSENHGLVSPSALSVYGQEADDDIASNKYPTPGEAHIKTEVEHEDGCKTLTQSPWYIHSRQYIRKIRGGEVEAFGGKEISPHHRPFTPYVERNTEPASRSLHWEKDRFIPTSTIASWLNVCHDMHGSRCGDNTQVHDTRNGPSLLIDTFDGCLISAPSDVRYVAPSYVWGNSSISSSTTQATLPLFKQQGGLFNDRKTLPKVVHEALKLARDLGERYLWVDRFCIVQDDLLPKLRQLSLMGYIYANAYFTIVAAGHKDAAHGLYGQRKVVSETRTGTPSIWSGSSPDRILLEQAYRLMQTEWYSRGWTMQEYLLSRRRVIFHNDTVNWECICSAWNEMHVLDQSTREGGQTPGLQTSSGSALPFEATPWPNMFRYARLVSSYNRRSLTYPDDIFYAFSGILTHLSRSFPGGFISGLPQMCFDAALLWQPWAQMNRRVPLKSLSTQPPSWSWAGWSGSMNSESWRSATNYSLEFDDEINAGQQCSWKTFSTVDWSYCTHLDDPPRRLKYFSEFSHVVHEGSSALPPNWVSEDSITQPSNGQLFYHISAPSQPFRYPIPIRDRYKAHIPPHIAQYLNGVTRHAFFRLGRPYKTTASSCPAADLLMPDGYWAGVLRLNTTIANADTYTAAYRDKEETLVEVIEISAGEVYNQPIEEKSFDEWNKEECPRHQGLYEFVNVFWVKWQGLIAHREALGRVKKDSWHQVTKKEITVTFG